jgi:hypothetical protein
MPEAILSVDDEAVVQDRRWLASCNPRVTVMGGFNLGLGGAEIALFAGLER